MIEKQTYYKVHQEIQGLKKERVTELRELKLYSTHLESKHRVFQLNQVNDVSVRRLSNAATILLHTTSGIYMYPVEEVNEAFIKALKEKIT